MRGGEELDDLDRYFAGLPAILLPPPDLTAEQVAKIEERFAAAMSAPPRYRYLYKDRWRYALPLPWHTRLRLWYTGRIDRAAIWLVDHGQERAAIAVWRITGHWRG